MKMRLTIALAMALMLVATLALPAVAVQEDTRTASVTVNSFVSISLSAGNIVFSDVTPPVTGQGASGQVNGTPAVTITIEAETNGDVDIGIKGAITTGTLALANWKYSTSFIGTKTSIPLAYGSPVYTAAIPGSVNAFYHWIDVPVSTDSGSHSITVTYKAVPTGTPF